jgi:hypothetical protein
MSTAGIFFCGIAVTAICFLGLVLSIAEMKRLGRGGGDRTLSMAISPGNGVADDGNR